MIVVDFILAGIARRADGQSATADSRPAWRSPGPRRSGPRFPAPARHVAGRPRHRSSRCSPSATMSGSSSSSGNSPAMASNTSIGVTRPSMAPNSSATSTSWPRERSVSIRRRMPMASCTMMGSRSRLRRTRPSVSRSAIGSWRGRCPAPRPASPGTREEAVRRLDQLTSDGVGVIVDVDPRHVGARRHDGANGALGQRQHAADHVALLHAEGRDGRRAGAGQVGLVGGRRCPACAARRPPCARAWDGAHPASRLRRASWFSASIATEKPMAAYR